MLTDDAHPGNINSALTQLGVGIFMALFEEFPPLLELFPFRDEDGRPIQAEMESHGMKVHTYTHTQTHIHTQRKTYGHLSILRETKA